MQESHHTGFLGKITEVIEENLSNEQFGVSELAKEIGMSRSNLLRKVQKLSNLSVSQFIRQVRLKHAMEMLKEGSDNVTEVSYKVGFSSTSYFIKCFREHYGFPPGEVGKEEFSLPDLNQKPRNKKWLIKLIPIVSLIIVGLVLYFIFVPTYQLKRKEAVKSIAVLPFRNDSNDSTNIYIVNGLMESVLTNLQKIENLNVISRTSVERYRNTSKSIREIGKELNVGYVVEGSGQKIGDKILLNIQVIDTEYDKHLWAEQYNRETKDIFQLQMDIAKNIANQVQVIITPEEERQINKIPTENLVAYDYFLKGMDLFYKTNQESLEEAILYFEKAIHEDSDFAQAYALIAISYYMLDYGQMNEKYGSEINAYSDKAMLLDPKLAQSLISKALFYIHNGEKKEAVIYLEKALEYNPNSALVINILSDFYTSYMPDTEKYLSYALKGVQLDIAAHDSITASFILLHVSNALVQAGFVEEAEEYVNKSLEYDPNNLYSEYVKAYIILAKDKDFENAKESLIKAFQKDTTRLDIMQEIGKICYFMRDYQESYKYYKTFIETKEALNLSIYPAENAKIGVVLDKVGHKEKSDKFFKKFYDYAKNDQSIYKNLNLATYYSYQGEIDKSIKHFKLFSEEDNYFYWLILFMENDPLVDNIKDHPEFTKVMDELERKFWSNHKSIKKTLKQKRLI